MTKYMQRVEEDHWSPFKLGLSVLSLGLSTDEWRLVICVSSLGVYASVAVESIEQPASEIARLFLFLS